MLLDYVVGALIGMIHGVLDAILPTAAAPLGSIGPLTHAYAWFNTWLPVYEALDAMRTTVAVMVVIAGFYVVIWALRQVPLLGLGGR